MTNLILVGRSFSFFSSAICTVDLVKYENGDSPTKLFVVCRDCWVLVVTSIFMGLDVHAPVLHYMLVHIIPFASISSL